MKKFFAICSLLLVVISAQATMQKLMSFNEADLANLKDLGDPKLENANSKTVILFGDTQTYTQFSVNHGILNIMTAWVAQQQPLLNISAVIGVGDIVQFHDRIRLTPIDWDDVRKGVVIDGLYRQKTYDTDTSAIQQWQAVSHAFKILDNRVAYFLTTGNHDHGQTWGEARFTRFNEFFNVERNHKNFEALQEVGFNEHWRDCLQNAMYKLDVGESWKNTYVLCLEFKPRKEVIKWATDILSKPKYKNARVILVTHSFIDTKANFSNDRHYAVVGLSADEVWNEFVKKTPQIKAVFCGHQCLPTNSFVDSLSFKTLKNDFNKDVHIMMFNPQCIGGGWSGNGGDGWLRILEFLPDGETIKVKTFSPLFWISPMTKHLAWRVADYDMFDMILGK